MRKIKTEVPDNLKIISSQTQQSDVLSRTNCRGEIRLTVEKLPLFLVGRTVTLQVFILNASAMNWPALGDHPVHFSYHWLAVDGSTLVGDGRRTSLPHDLRPEEGASLLVDIDPPPVPGPACLQLTLVQEGRGWFEEYGFQCINLHLDVLINEGQPKNPVPDDRVPSSSTGSPGLIILGMHRSGSSCLAGMLQCAGFFAGNVFLWNEDNRKGNQEDLRVIELNNLVLHTSQGSWITPPDRVAWTPDAALERNELLNEFAAAQVPWMFKDPRTLFTLPFWVNAIGRPRLLGIFRHPLSVAQSLSTRNGLPILKGLELWAAYNAALLHEFECTPFPIVCFDLPRDEFVASVKYALTTLCGDLVADGRLNLESLAEFFDDALVHQGIESGGTLEVLRRHPGIDGELITRAEKMYFRLCELSGFVSSSEEDKLLVASPSANSLDGLLKIEQAAADGNFDVAYQACEEMLTTSPRRADLWMRLLGLARSSSDPFKIESTVKRGLAMLPSDPYFWLERAKLHWHAKAIDDAFRAAEIAAMIAQDWLEPRLQLAAWAAGNRKWEVVQKWLTPLVLAGKCNRWSKAMLGVSFVCGGDLAQGDVLIAEAISEMSTKEKVGLKLFRVWAQEEIAAKSKTDTRATDVAAALTALQRELENMDPISELLCSALLRSARGS